MVTTVPNTLRAYLLDLKAGHRGIVRPEIPANWTTIVQLIERQYDKSGGSLEVMKRLFESYEKAYPELERLLNPLSTLAREEDESGMPTLPKEARLPENLSRGACPELETCNSFFAQASPEAWPEYYPFCAMWGFSAIAGRRAFTQLQRKKVYGNLSIVLCGRSTLIAKTMTADIIKDLLVELELKHLLLEDRLTPQKLLSNMSGTYVPANYGDLPPHRQEQEQARLAMPSQKACHYDEFGHFVQSMLRKGSSMADYKELLLKLDNCPMEMSTDTFSRNREIVEKPFFTLLGTMVPGNIRESGKTGADFWTDGFWARFSFVCAPTSFFITNTLKRGRLSIPGELIDSLSAWHTRLGVPACSIIAETNKDGEPTGKYTIERGELPETELECSDLAFAAYERYRIAIRSLIAGSDNHDFDASYGRLPETALRMALIMASLSGSRSIEIRHWAKAQELAEVLRRNLHVLYAQVNVPQQASTLEEDLIQHLVNQNGGHVTASEIKQYGPNKWRKLPSATLTKTLDALAASGAIGKERFQGKLAPRFFAPPSDEPLQGGEGKLAE